MYNCIKYIKLYVNYIIINTIYTLVIINLCVCARAHVLQCIYGNERINFMSSFSLSTMNILGKLSSGHQAR